MGIIEMVPIKLSELPKGKEFEEYISAFFQSNGYFIERNVEETDLLELDLIITNYNTSPPEIKLLEVKSGNWGFSDIFKVRGWMDYLNIRKGIFIATKERDKFDFYEEKANVLDIDLKVIPDLEETKDILSDYATTDLKKVDLSSLRFSYWLERNLLRHLKVRKKSNPELKRFKALESCYSEANDKVFFTENIFEKIDWLYSMFQLYPHLSAKCANEMSDDNFDTNAKNLPPEIYKKTYFGCEYNEIQISAFIEHRMRLTILKNAIDFKLYEKAGIESLVEDEIMIKVKDHEFRRSFFLPDSFKKGLDKISEHEYYYKYPIFWQWFLWVFGGFILNDYKEEEHKLLSDKTGIPIDEIPNAFDSYDILFPVENGWFVDLSPNSNLKMIKMFSIPFMGMGANYRRLIHTENQKFDELKLSGMHTRKDLLNWYNLTYDVLYEFYDP